MLPGLPRSLSWLSRFFDATRVRQTKATSLLFETTEITSDALRQGCRHVPFAHPLAGALPTLRQTDFCVLVFDFTAACLTLGIIENLDFFDYSVS